MTTTTNKGYELQSTGSNTGTWGSTLNTSVFQIIDNNLGSITTKSLSASDVPLSSSESQSAILRLTGTLLANVIVTTSCYGFFFVENLTSGNFSVTLTNGAGTSIIPPQYCRIPVLSDSTNGLRFGAPAIPPGTIMDYAGASGTIPPYLAGEWLFCDGSSLSSSSYPGLFAAIGYTYGGSSGTFYLPDLRGRARFGRDNMGGSTAGRITVAGSSLDGTLLGTSGGAQNVTLTQSQLPTSIGSASSSTTIAASGGSASGNTLQAVYATSFGVAAPGSSFVAPAATANTTFTLTATTTTTLANSSGGNAHANIPPAMILNALIKT